jgi:predicted DsbA family dithiol-disulfide isomerase
VAFTIQYLPYQLYPDFSSSPLDKREWHTRERLEGSADRQAAYEAHMSSLGAPAGINFRFNGEITNTIHAHRVIQHFQARDGPETASKLVAALYKRYFEEEKSPGSKETLIGACLEAGIDESAAKAVVEDESEGLSKVKNMIRRQASNGIDSVPHVMIEGRRRDITLVGAKEVEEYSKALQAIIKESK